MIIEQLELRAFGRFSGETLDLSAGPRRFHLVYGPNESGKSTCLRAISALLFGIPTRTVDAYQHPNSKLRIGARLIDRRGQSLDLVRRKNGKHKLHAEDDRTPINPAQLEQMLGGVDESTFHHRFGLSHEQLVEGGQAVIDSKGELGEILFAAGAGVGQLKRIRTQLDEEAKELFLERGKKTINLLLKDLEEKRKSLRDLQTPAAEYDSLRKKLAEAETEAKRLGEQALQTDRLLKERSAYRKARTIVPIWKREKTRLGELGDVPTLDDDFAARRREASINRSTHQDAVDQLVKEISAAKSQIDAMQVDPSILEHAAEIVSLFQGIAEHESQSKQRQHLTQTLHDQQHQIVEILRELGRTVGEDTDQETIDSIVQSFHVNESVRTRISELARQDAALRQMENTAWESLETQRKLLADLEDELDRTPDVEDPGQLEMLLSEIGSPSTLLDQVENEHITCRDLQTECDRLMRELRLQKANVDDAVELNLPAATEVDDHEEKLAAQRQIVKEVTLDLKRLRDKHADVQAKLKRLDADRPLPTEEELRQARQERDRHVDHLESIEADVQQFREVLRNTTREVRQSIRGADGIVDTIRMHHQQVAERAALAAEMKQLNTELGAAETSVDLAEKSLDQAIAKWESLWEPIGVPAASPREMRSWMAKHHALVEKHASLQSAHARKASLERRVDRHCSRLESVIRQAVSSRPISAGIGDVSQEMDEGWGLERLHDHANSIRQEMVRSVSKREMLIRRRDEAQAAIPSAEAKHQAGVNQRRKWSEDWKKAVQNISQDEQDASPAVIDARLKTIDELTDEIRQRDQWIRQAQTIENDREAFVIRVDTVAKLCGCDPGGHTGCVETVGKLYEELQAARNLQQQVEHLRKKRAKDQDQLETQRRFLAQAEGQLSELCREAKAQSESELAEVEAMASEKRKRIAALSAAEEQLVLIAGGMPLEPFADTVESYDEAGLDAEINAFEIDLENTNQKRSQVLETVGALKKELERIDGGGRAAELNQEIQLLTGRIERDARRYAKLRVAAMMLQRSMDHYRSENESPVLKLACEAFRELTCGRYIGLKPEFDDKGRSKLFGITPEPDQEETLVPVEAMSLGTADAVYLAMRLASLEHQLSAGQGFPVVIDDCLIQLDDERAVAAMKCFSRLSERTQVILFTHHQHLVDLAQESMQPGDYHVHRLSV